MNKLYTFSIDPTPSVAQAMSATLRPQGLHDANSMIDIYIDGHHVYQNGTISGIQLAGGDERWYHLEIQYRNTNNTVTTANKLPEFSV